VFIDLANPLRSHTAQRKSTYSEEKGPISMSVEHASAAQQEANEKTRESDGVLTSWTPDPTFNPVNSRYWECGGQEA
jgi:hypothetical protein